MEVFRQVYEDGCYSIAGSTCGTTVRGIKKLLSDMSGAFGIDLFSEADYGKVRPTAFGERLFNDTRTLDLAMSRLMEKVGSIQDHGRVLRVGTSPSIFRTSVFRAVFCELQAMEGFKSSYVQLGEEGYAKALQHGLCDLYLGFESHVGDRFSTESIAKIPLKNYLRGCPNSVRQTIVHNLASQPSSGRERLPVNINYISEERWIHWLDHPADCKEGTTVRSPEMSLDSRFWTEVETDPKQSHDLALNVIFLKQHPFEFLSKIPSKLNGHA